jgi:hydrogenase maturation protein HypF
VELESVAAGGGDARPYPFRIEDTDPFVVDLRPAVRAVAADLRARVGQADVALRLHETMASVVAAAARRSREAYGVNAVALSGGCFQNRILTERACDLLEADRFRVLVHRRVPPNDGGVALGQAAVARRACMEGRIPERRSADVPCGPG